MDHTMILLVWALINSCLVLGDKNLTESTMNVTGYVTNTASIDMASSPGTSPAHGQTTNKSTTDYFRDYQDVTSTRTYNKMTPRELTSWITGLQSTFTNHVKRLPHTKPITQISTTQPTQPYSEPTAMIRTTNEQPNITREVSSILTKLLTTGGISVTGVATDAVTRHHVTEDTTTSSYVKPNTTGDYSPTEGVNMFTGAPDSNTTESKVETISTGNIFDEILGALPDISGTTGSSIDPHAPGVDIGSTADIDSMHISEQRKEQLEKKKLEEMKSIQRKQLLELLQKINGTRRLSVRHLERLGLDMFTRDELAEIVRSMNMKIDKEKEKGKGMDSENMGNVDEVISMDKLLVVVSTISGALILFIVIMCIIYCRKGKSEPNNESMKSDITLQLSKKSKSSMEDSNGKVNSDSFMGIPPNNDIWKELQELPRAGSTKDKDTQSCKF